jgi:hypothetical protein
MKNIAALVLLVSVALSSAPSAADSKSVLADLGKGLHHARSSHSEEKLKSSCSTKLNELVGLSKKTILDALGNPDLNEDVVSRHSDPFSLLHYYLRPQGTAITFTIGASNVVTAVSCA